MANTKKNHSVGAAAGGIPGAAASDSFANVMNPTTYADHWQSKYKSAPYHLASREWSDYEPAYKLGYSAHSSRRGGKFEDAESEVKRKWEAIRGNSRLAWLDAKGAVRDGWNYLERTKRGESGRGGH